jgi:hypothetical protein
MSSCETDSVRYRASSLYIVAFPKAGTAMVRNVVGNMFDLPAT